jgi:hypothetical protein
MGYAQLSDGYHDHHKTKRAFRTEPAAVAIHVMAITYCNLHNNNGVIPGWQIDQWLAELPYRSERKQRVLNTLIDTNLLLPMQKSGDNCYEVVSFLQWNRSKAQRKRLAEIGRKGGKSRKRAESDTPDDTVNGSDGLSDGLATALSPFVRSKEEANASPLLGENRGRQPNEDDRRLCRLVAELGRAHNPKLPIKNGDAWLRDMRLIRERDGSTPEETEQLIRWVFSDRSRRADFWWADVIQSPGNLRKHYARMWAQMRSSALQAVPPVEDSAAFLARRGAA